jgi:hypothetical protein
MLSESVDVAFKVNALQNINEKKTIIFTISEKFLKQNNN